MKKILLFVLALIWGLGTSLWASNEIEMCGVTISDAVITRGIVDSLNAIDGVTASGTITYDPTTYTLTLDNASVVSTIDDNLLEFLYHADSKNITIYLKGSNLLKVDRTTGYKHALYMPIGRSNVTVTITGPGSLDLENSSEGGGIRWSTCWLHILNTTVTTTNIGDSSTPYGNVKITNSNVRSGWIGCLGQLVLEEYKFVSPANAEYTDNYIGQGSKGIKPAWTEIVIQRALTLGKEFEVDGVKYKVSDITEGREEAYVIPQAYTASSLVIPDSVQYYDWKLCVDITNNAFWYNENITSVDIACRSVGDCAFLGCTNLTSVTLREGVESLNMRCFEGIGATSIHMPASLSSMGNSGYSVFGKNKLEQITIAEGNENFVIGEDGAMYTKDMTKLVAYPYNYPKKFAKIPETVTSIYKWMFKHCSNIADTLVIPENLTGSDVFSASSVKCVILNNNYISDMFQSTASIEEIIIGKNVTNIKILMFYRCSGIRKITVLGNSMPVWGTKAFGDDDPESYAPYKQAKVYVHCGLGDTFKADADKWANFKNIVDTLLYDVKAEAGENGTAAIAETTDCNRVRMVATPAEHYELDQWSNGLKTAEITLDVTSDTAVTASFKQKQYTITFWTDDTKTTKITSTKATYNTSVADVAEYAQSQLTTPECARFIKWSNDNIAAVQGSEDLWPVWENPTTYTVVFKNRDTDAAVATRTEVECGMFANPPAAESGYKWQWESEDYKNVKDDLVIYGKLVANATGMESVHGHGPAVSIQKVLIDGQLYLMYEGRMYDVRGTRVK